MAVRRALRFHFDLPEEAEGVDNIKIAPSLDKALMLGMFNPLMDSRLNPLKNLPLAQQCQISFMLSAMWTLCFCASLAPGARMER